MLSRYINKSESIAVGTGKNDKLILKTIAEHFIGNNVEKPYEYKLDFVDGIKMNDKGQYIFDFDYFNVENGYICSAQGQLYCYEHRGANFDIKTKGPTCCYVNNELVYNSMANDEGERFLSKFFVNLKKGYNIFRFTTEKTTIGFGFTFGNTMPQWEPYLFQSVGEENFGQLGFRFTKPYLNNREIKEEQFCFPKIHIEEKETFDFEKIFGANKNGYVYAKAKIIVKDTIKLTTNYKVSIASKPFERYYEKSIKKGEYTIIIELEKSCENDFENNENFEIKPFVDVQGYSHKWLYLGVLKEKITDLNKLHTMNEVFIQRDKTYYWKPFSKNLILRPYVESELYGRFTYPMGVTLYGMLECGKFFNIHRYKEYVINNVEQISKYQNYSLFDKTRSGFPSLNQQICWLEELDDCGSFGSLMLECYNYKKIGEILPMAHSIADFMMNKVKREKDGAFSRGSNTMWIDDMYMSIPFLSRYYKLTEDTTYIDEAIKQILLYKKYFFINKSKLMSHIYDLKWNKANGIPWSRGNGWVIFSISEILKVLPKDYGDRNNLVEFFNEMAEGLLEVQGSNGMWHQVLDEPTTYYESSSTAMFICAFSRSIQENYVNESIKTKLLESINKAWEGLIYDAIDIKGNLYGVCRGSGCSFSRNYYKNLSWRYNDAHGIGIVLLAGVEKNKLS